MCDFSPQFSLRWLIVLKQMLEKDLIKILKNIMSEVIWILDIRQTIS